MGRKTIRREAWEFLNSRNNRTPKSLWVPKMPSILTMLLRCGMLFVLNAGLWALEIVIIYGQNSLYTFAFVNTLYKNMATNQFAIGEITLILTWFFIWGIGGIIWVIGYWDRWFD